MEKKSGPSGLASALAVVMVGVIVVLAACAPAAAPPGTTVAPASPTPTQPKPAAAESPQAKAVTPTPLASPPAKSTGTSVPAAGAATKPSGLPPLNPRVKVRLGSQNLNQEGPRLYAMERGYFADEGIDVEVVPIAQATDLLQAVATNQIDVAVTGWTAIALNMIERKVDLKVVYGAGEFTPGKRLAVFAVRKDLYDSGQVRSFKELKGHSVGVAVPGSVLHFWLLEQLKRAGLTEKEIDQRTLSFPDQLAAFANKGLDAAMMVEPFGATAEQQGAAVVVRALDQDYPNLPGAAGWTSPAFVKKEDVARRWTHAWWRGAIDWNRVWLPERPDPAKVQESVDLGKKYGVNISPLAPFVVGKDGLPHTEALRDLTRFFREFLKIESNVTFDPVVDDRFIKEAVAKLGPAE